MLVTIGHTGRDRCSVGQELRGPDKKRRGFLHEIMILGIAFTQAFDLKANLSSGINFAKSGCSRNNVIMDRFEI